jgi:ABC-type amino acid transport system permease subunit
MINWLELTIQISYPSMGFIKCFAAFWLIQTLICIPGAIYTNHLINKVRLSTLRLNTEKPLMKKIVWWFTLSPLAFIFIPRLIHQWSRKERLQINEP